MLLSPPENKSPETTRPPKRRPCNVEPDQIWRPDQVGLSCVFVSVLESTLLMSVVKMFRNTFP
jgi:hypothetical protein